MSYESLKKEIEQLNERRSKIENEISKRKGQRELYLKRLEPYGIKEEEIDAKLEELEKEKIDFEAKITEKITKMKEYISSLEKILNDSR